MRFVHVSFSGPASVVETSDHSGKAEFQLPHGGQVDGASTIIRGADLRRHLAGQRQETTILAGREQLERGTRIMFPP